jgi:hypothetical protein
VEREQAWKPAPDIHTPSVLSILALHISTVTNRNQMWKKELDGEKNGVEHKWIK